MCPKCPLGTFNSVSLVKHAFEANVRACTQCTYTTSTVSEGSSSPDQCLCKKGHYPNPDPTADVPCLPCPPGTWKDTVANSGCMGNGCPANSSSNVSGAVSAADRRCACNPGYVWSNSLRGCVLTPPGMFSPGGYLAAGFECPLNTTTVSLTSGPFAAVGDCACSVGFAPARGDRLLDPNSAEHRFRAWIRSIPEYANVGDSQICVPCGPHSYKETVAAASCSSCPAASYSSSSSSSSKRLCSNCLPGFYLTENEDIPCGKCPQNAFCVGSSPLEVSLLPFKNARRNCPQNAATLPNSPANDHPLKCLVSFFAVCVFHFSLSFLPFFSSFTSCLRCLQRLLLSPKGPTVNCLRLSLLSPKSPSVSFCLLLSPFVSKVSFCLLLSPFVSFCLLLSPFVSKVSFCLLLSPFVSKGPKCLRLSPALPHFSEGPNVSYCLLLSPIVSVSLLLSPIVSYCLRFSPIVSYCLLLSPFVSYCLLLSPYVSYCLLLSPIVSYCLLLSPFLSISLLLSPFVSDVSVCLRLSPWPPRAKCLLCAQLPAGLRAAGQRRRQWETVSPRAAGDLQRHCLQQLACLLSPRGHNGDSWRGLCLPLRLRAGGVQGPGHADLHGPPNPFLGFARSPQTPKSSCPAPPVVSPALARVVSPLSPNAFCLQISLESALQ
ncbi:cysteine repeat modular protein 2 homologue [Eimeria tenella]|uniref:Cysteine repeat modular protein 2 homologue n=1 Tax=Eimeria tenella TaxID=5802 RepID=C8TDZ8_EIMTE|nr:cysteine repeat modular protein 2 homologue [Eimeria tenella]